MSMAAEVARLFARDAALWTDSGEDAWLGWIDAVEEGQLGLPDLQAWAGPLGASHERVVLCGMGGSSLAPLVIGELNGSDRLLVLDSTDPDAVRAVPVEGSLFVIASKSGSTLEPSCFADAFWEKTGGDRSRFVAITDPGSALEERARSERWAQIAHGRPDVGGRYSALTAFGLVPAVLAGHRRRAPARERVSGAREVPRRLRGQPERHARDRDRERARARARQADVRDPPAAGLDRAVARAADRRVDGQGRHRRAAGRGRAARPRRSPTAPTASSSTSATDPTTRTTRAMNTLRAAGHPVFTQQFDGAADLGALFIEWEIATALVGAKLHINPFDQPNVQEAKDRTVAILEGFARDGKLPVEEAGSIAETLAHAEEGRSYVCLQAFVAPTAERQAKLERLQTRIRDVLGCAVTAGFGPRYLHSTGQYHKGGPPNGVFVQLLAGEQDDEMIPGRAFGFRTLRDAQALGDAGALRGRGLPLARISLAACEAAIERALENFENTRIST